MIIARRRRVIFVNRFYYPDYSATAQILTDLAETLVAVAWQVEVVTSRLQYENPAIRQSGLTRVAHAQGSPFTASPPHLLGEQVSSAVWSIIFPSIFQRSSSSLPLPGAAI